VTSRFLLLGGAMLGGLMAHAAPITVKKTQVNGLDVYLINMRRGNGEALTVNVQAGSNHDEPVRHAGLAHYWEHVIHGGSQKYPGHKTFFAEIRRTGAQYNAYTSGTRIYYHPYYLVDARSEVESMLGAM